MRNKIAEALQAEMMSQEYPGGPLPSPIGLADAVLGLLRQGPQLTWDGLALAEEFPEFYVDDSSRLYGHNLKGNPVRYAVVELPEEDG